MTGLADLSVTVSRRELTNDGSEATVQVTATTALGKVGSGTVHVESSAGSLKDGVDLTLDSFGTARTPFTCPIAADPGCDGRVTFTASWNAEKQTLSGQTNVSVIPPPPQGGGSGGGAGGGTGGGGTDLSGIPCPGARRIVVYQEPNATTPILDEPLGLGAGNQCTSSRCEFVELSGGGVVYSLVLLSVGSPSGTPLAADPTQRTAGRLGDGSVYRLQFAATGLDCASMPGHVFKIEELTIGGNSLSSFIMRFECQPATGEKLRGCAHY
ncbi:MAG: hypothetical protein Q8L48_21985 [Archangium sp.]|nr:hypothetical protein [Archangium sp.]